MRRNKNFSAESLPARNALGQLSRSLLALHKLLLDETRDRYLAEVGTIENRFKLLDLVINDPFFAWLHPLSQLIVRIDELAENEFEAADVLAVHAATAEMLDSGNPVTDFARQYSAALLMHPDLIMAHADAKQALNGVRVSVEPN